MAPRVPYVLLFVLASVSWPKSYALRLSHGKKECPLPTGARWCEVRVPGVKSFRMATWENNDIVSQSICNTGSWEQFGILQLLKPDSVTESVKPGNAFDIGGNIGFYTLVLAQAGWTVNTFEPMPGNLGMIRASLCENEDLASRVTVHPVGLGASPDTCQLISGKINVGDGIMRCGAEKENPVPSDYEVRSIVEIKRLDDVLATQDIGQIDFLKIDVEGFECQVFKGAEDLLTKHRPKVIQSEVWPAMQGCKSQDYLDSFKSKHYSVAKDMECLNGDSTAPTTEIDNFFMCAEKTGLEMRQTNVAVKKGTRRIVLLRADTVE